jgi:hypothetical protein
MLAMFGAIVVLSAVRTSKASVSVERATGEAIARPRKESTKRIATVEILVNCILLERRGRKGFVKVVSEEGELEVARVGAD